jgi:2-octaprenyl-6-methoxyphenol hydroxylase
MQGSSWFIGFDLDSFGRSRHNKKSIFTRFCNAEFVMLQPVVDYDLAIVGGGIVGLTLACALRDSGLKVALIDAGSLESGLQRRRAYHISLMSGQILSSLGLWEQIVPHITTFHQIQLADADYPVMVRLQPDDLGTPALGYVAEHRVLVQALHTNLQEADPIAWLCSTEVVGATYGPDTVTLTLRHQGQDYSLQTRLVVAADGARSPLRQQAGISTHGWQYWQSCITAVIRPEKSHGNIAREHFWSSGPFATLPLPENRAQIVLTAPHADAQALMQLADADFLAELEHRYRGQLGRLELVGDRALFPVQLMHSDRYVSDRLVLVGDAAHCCHPVGGQGLNAGIRDVAALAEVLKIAQVQKEDIGALSVLQRYERWRRWENLTILGFTDLLNRCFSNSWWPLVVMRRLGLWALRAVRPLKKMALRLMTGLSGRYPIWLSEGRNSVHTP